MESVFPKAIAPTAVCPFHTSGTKVAAGSANDSSADSDGDSDLDHPND
jgi:hypothetical protein